MLPQMVETFGSPMLSDCKRSLYLAGTDVRSTNETDISQKIIYHCFDTEVAGSYDIKS